MTDWKPLSELAPGVLPSFTPPPPPPIRADAPQTWTPPAPVASFGAPRNLGPKPANNLVGAILVTLFCCLPFGIPAIIFASQVDGKYNAGDQAGAEESAAKAKKWMWIAFAVGLVGGVIYFGLVAVGVASGAAGGGY
jgi:hypothetical protein